ncbi:protease pro-enzyme activation domain-containing protein [Salinisphaera sp. Q1T1-3]|uniref:S53 family peptidase n=1 Tax=Salinisphaera sp. Q1T1-3 TaxID=2321229 RepID=UPI000E754F1B|nr:S53 family peptidase [Salinisphaera sp. Q1T1-3]RJS91931.1 peptidase S53 [Salinisphaera sp. Q1T1-3]
MLSTTIRGSRVLVAAIVACTSVSAFADAERIGPVAADQAISTTVLFQARDEAGLARFVREVSTPGPHYHHFLSTTDFRQRFGATAQDIARVIDYARANGLTVTKRYENGLAVQFSGPAASVEQAFNVEIANYAAPDTDSPSMPFYKPARAPSLPAAFSDSHVLAVAGLSNQRHARSMATDVRHAAHVEGRGGRFRADLDTSNEPGELTVQDVARLYNVAPLYRQGLRGEGVTIGIATYASFLPSDAETYWQRIGLETKPDRITQIAVAGGGEYGDDAGTGETTLDVEQSGGLAPQADIRVYVAPNTDSGELALFNRIVSDNDVDVLSYSWGISEVGSLPSVFGTGADASAQALNQLLMEAAAQGISTFVAAGDAGGYDVNDQRNPSLAYPTIAKVASVDLPAASPYVTAAGGTTLPFSARYRCARNPGDVVPVRVNAEQAWSLSYFSALSQLCGAATPADFGIFPEGGGGGVSSLFPVPFYQQGVDGIRKTPYNQALVDFDSLIFYGALPGGFAGRNVPDISMNADPYTGYTAYVTLDGGMTSGGGGTSYVAPQLAGMAALFNQATEARLGLLNPILYRALRDTGYATNSPFRDVTAGSNWFWQSRTGYDPATGIGTPDAARLLEAIQTTN